MISKDDIDAFKDNEPTEQGIYIQKLEQILKDNLSKSNYDGEIYCLWVTGTPWVDPDGILIKIIT
jgi:hypothetical protein